MNLKTQYEFLFVGRDDSTFLENYSYNVSEGDLGSAQIFMCLEIQNNPADAEIIGERLFESFKKSFFSQKDERDSYVRFENSLKELNRVVDGFREATNSGHIGRLHAIVVALSGDNLYLSQTGDAEAYLIRKRFVTSISEGLYDPESREIFTSIANGNLEEGDFVLFSTTRLLRYISKTNLARFITSDVVRTLNDLREAVMPEILGRIGFIGVSVGTAADDAFVASSSSGFSLTGFLGHVVDFFDISYVKEIFEKAKNILKKGVLEDVSKGISDGFAKNISERVSENEERGKSFVKRLADKLSGTVSSRFSSEGFTKDKILALFIVVILLLTFGVWIVKTRTVKNAKLLAFDTLLNQAREQVSDAEAKGQYDKQAAAVILENAETKAREVLNSGFHRGKSSEVLALISRTRDLLDDIRRISDPRVLADLSKKDSSVNGHGFVSMNNRFFVYDGNRIFEVLLDNVQEPLSLDAGEVIISATAFEERESVLFFTKSGKLYELKDGVIRQMATLDGAFRKGVAIEDWGNRVYVLDADGDQVWRYPYIKSRDVFATAEEYKIDGSLKDAVDFAIDANVYVLNKKDGEVFRYYGGSRQNFIVQNAPFTAPEEPLRLYTDGEITFAFVLDGGAESKIYVYGKDSASSHFVYRYQVLLDGISGIRDVFYSQNTNQIYVMDSKKIYEITL